MSETDRQREEEERQLAEAIALSLESSQPRRAEEDEMARAMALSMQQPAAEATTDAKPTPADDFADADAGGPSLARLVFGDRPSGEVMRQWRSQGITLADVDLSEAAGITPFSAGLAQDNGGPCAVLAAAQAFMLRRLLFDPAPAAPQPTPVWLDEAEAGDGSLLPSDTEAMEALLCGLADILCGCATAPTPSATAGASSGGGAGLPPAAAGSLAACPVVLALPSGTEHGPLLEATKEALVAALVGGAARPCGWAATLQALRARRAGLASPIGALCVLLSAVLTRRTARFCEERDDAAQPLLDPQFGHCSQELLNLLLLGVGVSNVFDGNRDLGGGFLLKGVPSRPAVGLLSQLEALRYLQVTPHSDPTPTPHWDPALPCVTPPTEPRVRPSSGGHALQAADAPHLGRRIREPLLAPLCA
jgi:hypothetical protein